MSAASVIAACSNGVCSSNAQQCSSDGTPQMCQTTDNCGDRWLCFSTSSPYYWENEAPCSNGSSCVVVAGNAVCSMTKSPDPSCADGGSICFGNDVVACTGGYPVFVQDCVGLTCKLESRGFQSTLSTQGIASVQNANCAYCSSGLEVPNAGCAAGQTYTCANGSIFGCSCADRQSSPSTLCADAGDADDNDGGDAGDGGASPTCVSVQRPGSTEIGYIDSFCAFSSQPDPQCGDKVENAYCGSSGFEVSCWDGYAVPGASIPCR
jgi:hypothetical protein